ncbi:unnamed protein product [Discosporangium mesarthrocarpum]
MCRKGRSGSTWEDCSSLSSLEIVGDGKRWRAQKHQPGKRVGAVDFGKSRQGRFQMRSLLLKGVVESGSGSEGGSLEGRKTNPCHPRAVSGAGKVFLARVREIMAAYANGG